MTRNLKELIETQGYVIVEDVLDDAALQAIIEDYHQLLDRMAPQWYAQGLISSAYADLPFDERLTVILGEAKKDVFAHMDIALSNETVHGDAGINASRAVYDLIRNERLLDKVEEVVGGEILSNPIQHVRIKPAEAKVAAGMVNLTTETKWHQDQGVHRPNADDTEILTVWLAITDATIENGCLQVVPYSHLTGITEHCPFDQVLIPPHLLAGEALPVPIKAGDAIFMHRLTQHSSLVNVSDTLRWSFDLRYQPIGAPTGRDEFPSLIARSRENPAQVQSYEEWRDSWHAARDYLAGLTDRPATHRWSADAPVCA
ncbi:MAG: phytanoyl-CoA dioxygenase family protein [Chloroflexota bacterium]|nr:phytanoyl-CoA dioxygenase family protein [Chloroflexota bacterium]